VTTTESCSIWYHLGEEIFRRNQRLCRKRNNIEEKKMKKEERNSASKEGKCEKLSGYNE